eukprot:91734-Amphidinium_carterae.1
MLKQSHLSDVQTCLTLKNHALGCVGALLMMAILVQEGPQGVMKHLVHIFAMIMQQRVAANHASLVSGSDHWLCGPREKYLYVCEHGNRSSSG